MRYIPALLVSAAAVSGLPATAADNHLHWSQYTDDSMTLIHTSVVGDTTLYWFGDAKPQPESTTQEQSIQARCGSNSIECNTSHTANFSNCESMLLALGQHGKDGIPNSPRSLCANGCCVSWSQAVKGSAIKSNLGNAAVQTYNTCLQRASGNYISGLSRDTNIGGVCVTQCLSNRATGCS